VILQLQITPRLLQQHINGVIFPSLGIKKEISEKTADRWLRKLGYQPRVYKKGIYYDGHEREDVIAYRAKYLKVLEELEPSVHFLRNQTNYEINTFEVSSNNMVIMTVPCH